MKRPGDPPENDNWPKVIWNVRRPDGEVVETLDELRQVLSEPALVELLEGDGVCGMPEPLYRDLSAYVQTGRRS